MKDTFITARRKKRELYVLLICFVLANLLNVYAILVCGCSFIELVTSFFYILSFTIALYITAGIFRLLYWGIKCLLTRKKSK